MGSDEHGPAYPEAPRYRCGVCCISDRDQYLVCDHPMCPDGRDQACRLEARPSQARPRRPEAARTLVGWAIFIAFGLWLFWPHKAPAMDHGFDPNAPTTKWFESLPRPNFPGSCCGKGDAYPVESYWPNPDGTWTAKIGDGSAKKYPDGTRRDPIADGTEIIVPKEVVNRAEDDLDNPTDVSWIFMTVHSGEVGMIYCLIRHPSGG